MEINEQEMLNYLDGATSISLIEPTYKRKYIPLGLAKISSYAKNRNKTVNYSRGNCGKKADLYCLTSLFTYHSDEVNKEIDNIRFFDSEATILLGGIAASLTPNSFPKDVLIYRGTSQILDNQIPDYENNYLLEEPWGEFSFTFTSRGCPNRCPYCAVWRLEPDVCINNNWRDHILQNKPFAMISDNNLSAQPFDHIKDVILFLENNKKRVVFDNGFDCKHITTELANLLKKLKYVRSGCRLAFDRIEEDGIFQDAVKILLDAGVPKSAIMVYTLFNFLDKPKDANYRMRESVKLGVRPYPQQYTPLNHTDNKEKYIGKHWTPNLLRAFRFFWLMAGYYGKQEFETWVRSNDKHKLTDEDWQKWGS